MTSRSKSEFWGTLTITIILGMFALFGIQTLIEGLPEGNLWVLLNLVSIVAAAYFGRNTYAAFKTWRLGNQFSLNNETRPAWVGKKFSAVMKSANGHQAGNVNVWLEHFKVIRREESDGIAFIKVVDRKLPGQVEFIQDGKSRISVDIPEKSPRDVMERRRTETVVGLGRRNRSFRQRGLAEVRNTCRQSSEDLYLNCCQLIA